MPLIRIITICGRRVMPLIRIIIIKIIGVIEIIGVIKIIGG
jgi:hypothetical protein